MTIQDRFDKLIVQALSAADQIDCSPATYRDCLGNWVEKIQDCIAASRETDPEAS